MLTIPSGSKAEEILIVPLVLASKPVAPMMLRSSGVGVGGLFKSGAKLIVSFVKTLPIVRPFRLVKVNWLATVAMVRVVSMGGFCKIKGIPNVSKLLVQFETDLIVTGRAPIVKEIGILGSET